MTLEIVSVDVALPAPGVMVAGEKAQFSELETPLQDSAMGLLNDPDFVCAITVNVPDRPCGIVTDNGDALKDRVGGGVGVGEGAGEVEGHEGL